MPWRGSARRWSWSPSASMTWYLSVSTVRGDSPRAAAMDSLTGRVLQPTNTVRPSVLFELRQFFIGLEQASQGRPGSPRPRHPRPACASGLRVRTNWSPDADEAAASRRGVITGRPGRAVRLSFRRRRVISLLVEDRGNPMPDGARSRLDAGREGRGFGSVTVYVVARGDRRNVELVADPTSSGWARPGS